MIKNCYRLLSDKGFMEAQGFTIEQTDDLWDIDEDYTRKSEYIKEAKNYTALFNKKYNTSFTYQELFGEPRDIGYRYCTVCGETFWKLDTPHDCEE